MAGRSDTRVGSIDVVPRGRYENGHDLDDVGLKTLLGRLNQDATQLVHDELDLAKLELREVASTLSDEIHEATSNLVKDLAKLGIAMSLAILGGLALTAGAILAVGALLDAYWAGGLIVGIVLLIAAAVFGMSAAKDMKNNEAMRLERTRGAIQHDKRVLKEEARETTDFAKREAREFKDNVTRSH